MEKAIMEALSKNNTQELRGGGCYSLALSPAPSPHCTNMSSYGPLSAFITLLEVLTSFFEGKNFFQVLGYIGEDFRAR